MASWTWKERPDGAIPISTKTASGKENAFLSDARTRDWLKRMHTSLQIASGPEKSTIRETSNVMATDSSKTAGPTSIQNVKVEDKQAFVDSTTKSVGKMHHTREETTKKSVEPTISRGTQPFVGDEPRATARVRQEEQDARDNHKCKKSSTRRMTRLPTMGGGHTMSRTRVNPLTIRL